MVVFSLSDYAIVNALFVPQQLWIDEILSHSCKLTSNAFAEHSLIDLGQVMPIFGAYYGLLFQS